MINNTIKYKGVWKLITYFIFSFFTYFGCFSQKQNPIGTIFLKGNIYIDAAPVCNIGYGEFKYTQKDFFHYNIDSLEKMTKALPYFKFNFDVVKKQTSFYYNGDSLKYIVADTAKTFWNNWTSFKEYLHGFRFNFYPLVNVSQEAAANFCRWRTYMVKIVYATQRTKKQRQKKFDDFIYRLPTNEELRLASQKFTLDKNISLQQKKPGDSIANFNDRINKLKLNYPFKITSLQEIAINNNGDANSIYWDTNNFSLLTSTVLKPNEAHENLTFRCVCEIK